MYRRSTSVNNIKPYIILFTLFRRLFSFLQRKKKRNTKKNLIQFVHDEPKKREGYEETYLKKNKQFKHFSLLFFFYYERINTRQIPSFKYFKNTVKKLDKIYAADETNGSKQKTVPSKIGNESNNNKKSQIEIAQKKQLLFLFKEKKNKLLNE